MQMMKKDLRLRCDVCGWPLATNVTDGCVPGNCSQRPRPLAEFSEPLLEKVQASIRNNIEKTGATKILSHHKFVEKECVGFVVTVPALIGDQQPEVDVESIKAAYEKHFPGKPVVIMYGCEVQPIYSNDAAFKQAVAEAVREIVDKQLIEVHKRHHDDVGKAMLKPCTCKSPAGSEHGEGCPWFRNEVTLPKSAWVDERDKTIVIYGSLEVPRFQAECEHAWNGGGLRCSKCNLAMRSFVAAGQPKPIEKLAK